MKSIYVHLRNKFPGAKVEISDSQVAAYCGETGELLMVAVKNGLGQVVDAGADRGARYPLCMSPIPKECRRVKLFKDGHVGPAEEFEERNAAAMAMKMKFGYVPSELQLKHAKKVVSEREEKSVEMLPEFNAEGVRIGSVQKEVSKKVPVERLELPSMQAALKAESGL